MSLNVRNTKKTGFYNCVSPHCMLLFFFEQVYRKKGLMEKMLTVFIMIPVLFINQT